MNNENNGFYLRYNKWQHFQLCLFSFFFPISVFLGNLFLFSIAIFWLANPYIKEELVYLYKNSYVRAGLIFFLFHLLGLFWTENLEWGIHIVKKMLDFFIFLPIFMSVIKKEYRFIYVNLFILAMTISSIFSLLLWQDLISNEFLAGYAHNPTPFMSHISFNPFLVIASYLCLFQLLFVRHIKLSLKIFLSFSFALFALIMFITLGRGGQIMYFFMLLIIIFQYFGIRNLKSSIVAALVIPLVFILSFYGSHTFKDRVEETVENFYSLINNDDRTTSIGQRFTFAENSIEILKENFFFGVGTGDFPEEYDFMRNERTPCTETTVNPHNMYLLIATQLGFVGLMIFLYMFRNMIKISLDSNDNFVRKFGFALPLMFLLIMFSDSYLLGHFTTFLFIFFSAMIYKDFELN